MSSLSALIPFSGFYHTVHSEAIDSAEDFLMEGASDRLSEMFSDGIDWSKVHTKYSKEYVKRLGDLLGIEFEFEEIVNPREYNFTNDRVFAKVSEKDVEMMLDYVGGEDGELQKVLDDWFTRRPGFIPHYSNNLQDWPADFREWDFNQIGAVVEAYRRDDEEVTEQGIAESMEEEANLISEIVMEGANEKAVRAERICAYLRRRREERA